MWAKKDRRLALNLTALVIFLFELQINLSPVQCYQDVWQWITLYTEKGGGGEPLAIMEAEQGDLDAIGFANFSSECHNGAWIILNKKISEEPNGVYPLSGVGCQNVKFDKYFWNAIRFAGDPTNYTRDSLSLFETTFFGKSKQVFYTEGNVNIPEVNSLAATGSSDWTIYKDSNHQGKSYCVKFQYSKYAQFIVQLDDVEHKNVPEKLNKDWISSVKKGCHSSSTFTAQ